MIHVKKHLTAFATDAHWTIRFFYAFFFYNGKETRPPFLCHKFCNSFAEIIKRGHWPHNKFQTIKFEYVCFSFASVTKYWIRIYWWALIVRVIIPINLLRFWNSFIFPRFNVGGLTCKRRMVITLLLKDVSHVIFHILKQSNNCTENDHIFRHLILE
jgi:hypothetical protein